MISLLINGKPVSTTKQVFHTIYTVIITSIGATVVPKEDARSIADYVYNATQRCKGVIMYNGVIINKKDVKKHEGS